jgi:type II restriction enzyme
VDLRLPTADLDRYKSNAQRARVSTEPWGAENLYCPACTSPHIEPLPANTPAIDFSCPVCHALFQLKSKSASFGRRVQDGAFSSMKRTILLDRTPNLFLLRYSLVDLTVRDVLLIPRFVFSLSFLERRKPLSAKAQRVGWVGCNFLLDRIPSDARISVIAEGKPVPATSVRRAYDRLRPLEKIEVEKRGWTLDVLRAVQSLNKPEFDLSDVYAHAAGLAKLHPQNAHIHDKIRQQLQVLRDLGRLQFLGRGRYRLL